MGEGSRTTPAGSADSPSGGEDALLDAAMMDERLLASLRKDEVRLRRRRRVIGGFAMFAVVTTIITALILNGQGAFTNRASTRPSTTVSDADADKAATLSGEGWKLWQGRKYGEAENKFARSVKLDPTSSGAWNGLGWSRLNGGNPTTAEEAFNKAVEIDARHAAAQNGLGYIHFNRRDYKEAEKHWMIAIKTPGASAPWYGLTQMFLLTGRYDQAAVWARKVVKQQPADEIAKKMLAAAEAKSLDPELRKKIEPAEQQKSAGDTQRGWKLLNAGSMEQAVKAFESALAKDPKDAHAHNGLGFALLTTGRADEAMPHFETCLKLQPDHAGAMNGLARCLKEEGKTDQAVALWEKMVKDFPGPNAGTHGLAFVYMEKEDYKKALPLLEQLAKANPKDEQVKEALDQARKAIAEKK